MDLTLSRYHQARLDLVSGLKAMAGYRMSPQVRAKYQGWARDEQVPEDRLRDRAYLAGHVGRDPLYQASRGLQRITQELMWREVAHGLDAQRPDLEATLAQPAESGSLTLDPDLEIPAYFAETEFHLQPGGLWRDALTGPIYEIGVQHFNLHRFGKSGGEMGLALLQGLPEGIAPQRFLELGCGPGYKMYPVLDAFPQAEAHGIDISAPLLRYAHHRAADHGRNVAYAQMNAEKLTFADENFDLVYDMILLHEVPVFATRNILREAFRVLRPGGIYADLDLPAYRDLDPLTAFMMDWDTDHNGEPFWRDYHELDMKAEMEAAGFVDVAFRSVTSDALKNTGNYQGKWSYRVVVGRKP